jgi:hypothetical protein
MTAHKKGAKDMAYDWRRATLTAMLLFSTFLGARYGLSHTRIPRQACRFVEAYHAAGKSDVSGGWWERVTYSFLLASSQPPA